MNDKALECRRALQRAMLWNEPMKFSTNFLASETQAEDMAAMQLACVSVTGSWNYDLQTEESDTDLKAAYWPQFPQFYNGKFPHVSIQTVQCAGGEFDLTLSPVHELLSHVLKGNVGWVEMVYPRKEEYFWSTDSHLDYCVDRLRALAPMNAKASVMSALGHARKKMTGLHHYTPSTAQYEDRHGYNLKEACHAVRFVAVVAHLLKHGELNFVDHDLSEVVKMLKMGKMDEVAARAAWDAAEKLLLDRAFVNGTDKGMQWSKMANEVDAKGSDEWNLEYELFQTHLREVVEFHLR